MQKLLPKTTKCRICFQDILDINLHQTLHPQVCICQKCQSQFTTIFESDRSMGPRVTVLYDYNEFMKTTLFKLKACGDIEIASAFLAYHRPALKARYWQYVMIPAPSHPLHDLNRGFNHVVEIFTGITSQVVKAIQKTKERKQSDLSAIERQTIGEILRWDENVDIIGKKVLFVDDVMTTGATIKACLKMISSHGAKTIEVLVLSKVRDYGQR